MIGFQCLRIVQCKHREAWLIDFSACFEKKYEKTPNIGKKLAVLIFFYVGRKNWNILSQILGIYKKLPTQNCSTKLSGRQNPITNVTSLSYVWCTPFWILKTAKGKNTIPKCTRAWFSCCCKNTKVIIITSCLRQCYVRTTLPIWNGFAGFTHFFMIFEMTKYCINLITAVWLIGAYKNCKTVKKMGHL